MPHAALVRYGAFATWAKPIALGLVLITGPLLAANMDVDQLSAMLTHGTRDRLGAAGGPAVTSDATGAGAGSAAGAGSGRAAVASNAAAGSGAPAKAGKSATKRGKASKGSGHGRSYSSSPPPDAAPAKPHRPTGFDNGVACTFSSDCDSGSCTFGKCQTNHEDGEKHLGNGVACTFSSDCASGSCTFGKCQTNHEDGEKHLGNGVACTFSSDCDSGSCTFGKCDGHRDDY